MGAYALPGSLHNGAATWSLPCTTNGIKPAEELGQKAAFLAPSASPGENLLC